MRVSDDGQSVELLWGYADGGRPTSELPAHFRSHISRLSVDPEHRGGAAHPLHQRLSR